MPYSAPSILEKEPGLCEVLAKDAPLAFEFEFDEELQEFVLIDADEAN